MGSVKTVVLVNDTCNIIGGAAKVAIDNAICLAERGLNVVFFCAGGEADHRLVDAGVRIINLNSGLFLDSRHRLSAALQGLSSSLSRTALEEVLSDQDIDSTVVHVHSWTKGLSSSIFTACARFEIPVFITVHDYFLACPNGGLFDYRRAEICNLRPLSHGCLISNCDRRSYLEKVYRSVRSVFQDRNLRRISKLHLVYISEFSRRIIEPLITLKYIAEYCHNQISLPTDPVRAETSDRAAYDILFVGRVDAEKGILEFCEAAYATGYHAAVVGDGELLDALRLKFPLIDFFGWRSQQELARVGISSKVLVVPSRWYEVSPLTVYEMQAMTGIPALVADTCAAAEQIVVGTTGFTYEPGAATSLAGELTARLQRLASLDRRLIQRLALEQVERRSDIGNRLVAMYESALSR